MKMKHRTKKYCKSKRKMKLEIFKEKVKRTGWKLIFKMVKAYRSWHGHNTKREKITTGKNYEEKTWK